MRYSLGKIQVKSAGDSEIIRFEGLANHCGETDRHNDVIPPEEWRLEGYLDNPILLFNHDPYFPLGQSKSVEAVTEGLKIVGEVSTSSKDPETIRVKEAVASHILKALSVGIINKSSEKGKNGENILRDVDLHEVSIVAAGASQKALFNIIKSSQSVGQFVDMMEKNQEKLDRLFKEMVEIKATIDMKIKDFTPSLGNHDTQVEADILAAGECKSIIESIKSIHGL